MSDKAAVVHMGENSPEHVAYVLLKTIASNEGKSLVGGMGAPATADRQWLLSTYAECVTVVKNGYYAPAK
ncbi:hypothetical protein [Caulobacter sp. NIBR1757]|uniref:hypothetical protein n=1 Tax=Caulobacter sp. NIBR1757 TaxID=3016000 RepID=UPI0022F0CFD9|nr:hypothetical protein [Caulobacter sp. NIBR1757]WGM37778.1 hypothetical protein AMEJIAPC_00678 [Caulobacter sp. NIBR1757]